MEIAVVLDRLLDRLPAELGALELAAARLARRLEARTIRSPIDGRVGQEAASPHARGYGVN